MQKEITIITPQFERIQKLDFEHIPTTDTEFYSIIENAPFDILKGFGFGVWDTMNNIIKESIGREPIGKVTLPVFSMEDLPDVLSGEIVKTDNVIEFDCEPTKQRPTELLEIDENILLFPSEWYDIIPDGFMVTGLYGEQYPFEKGKTDDDKRFGCLAYGIRRKVV